MKLCNYVFAYDTFHSNIWISMVYYREEKRYRITNIIVIFSTITSLLLLIARLYGNESLSN